MTRRYTFSLFAFSLLSLAIAACVRAASNAPTPTLSPDFPAPETTPAHSYNEKTCRPSDLETSSNSSATNGTVTIGVTLTNITGYACQMEGDPQVMFLDASGDRIPIQTIAAEPNQTPPAPTTLNVIPGESVIVSMAWSNACPPLADEKITIRLTLSNSESLDVASETIPAPPCSDKNQPATLTVVPYSYPP